MVLSDNECGEVAIPSAKEVMHKAVFGYALKDSDVDVPSGTWLGCDTITAFQRLLQNCHPYIDGLQDVLLSQTNGFDIIHSQFKYYRLPLGHYSICNINSSDGVINWYDSLHCNPGEKAQETIASIIHSARNEIVINVMNVQRQQNGSDCGVFALAFATTLCEGSDPTEMAYDHSKMRSHMASCFDALEPQPFPVVKQTTRRKTVLKSVAYKIYCQCRLPAKGKMICCLKCKKWFHCACVMVKKEEAEKMRWSCADCCLGYQ